MSASKRWSEGALEPAVAGDEANAEVREESRIGYGRPPVATRFRRGVSDNPRGRPKGARNIATVVAATLGERISITENGRRKRITKLDAAVKQLVNPPPAATRARCSCFSA